VLEVDYFEEILKLIKYIQMHRSWRVLTMRQNGNLLETAIMLLEEYCFDGSVRGFAFYTRKN
jgi:hypothetical protein